MSDRVVKCVDASVEAFAPYGALASPDSRKADADCGYFKFWNALAATKIAGETSFGVVEAYASSEMTEEALEQHLSTTETLIPTNDIVVVVATSDAKDARKPDPASLAAFRVRAGDAVMFKKGAWHHAPLSLSGAARTYVVFDKATPDTDLFVVELPKAYGFKVKVDLSAIK